MEPVCPNQCKITKNILVKMGLYKHIFGTVVPCPLNVDVHSFFISSKHENQSLFCVALLKYRSSVNFINILREAFACADPKSAKKTDSSTVFFVLLGSVCKMLVKSTTLGVNFINIL